MGPSPLPIHPSDCGPTLLVVGYDMTTPTGWDQGDDPALDSPEFDSSALGVIALVIAVLSLLCPPTYFYSVLAYLGAAVALPLCILARGVPRSRDLPTGAVALAIAACVAATAVLVSVGG